MFMIIPVGAPARLTREHVDADTISDALGGAIPVALYLGHVPLAIHLRDDCASAGLGRNRLAAMLTTSLMFPFSGVPIVGPAVITSVELLTPAAPGARSGLGRVGCLTETVGNDLKDMADDLWLALAGEDDKIVPVAGTRLTPREWAEAVREAADRIDAVPLPAGYPYPRRDPVADALSRRGINVWRGQNSDLF